MAIYWSVAALKFVYWFVLWYWSMISVIDDTGAQYYVRHFYDIGIIITLIIIQLIK